MRVARGPDVKRGTLDARGRVGAPAGCHVAVRMPMNEPSPNRAALVLRHPHRIALLGVLLVAAASWQAVRAAPEADAAYDDTANCIAVMEASADELARQVKAGDATREPVLRTELRRGAALIGRTYLDGLHDEHEARARLEAARERQKTWDEARRRNVRNACVRRADAELAAASGVERVVVDRVAERKLQRMLSGP